MKCGSAFALASMVMAISVQGGQGRRGPDKRDLMVQVLPKGVVIQSQSKVEGFKDKLTFKLNQNANSMEAMLMYMSQTETVKANTAFDLRVFEIIEFTPTDAALGFQENDTIVSLYPEDKWEWAALGDDQGADLRTFTMGTKDGVFAFIAHVTSAVNGTLEPNSIKFDIAITGYPYQGNGTQLALRTKLRTKDKFKDGKNSTQVKIEMTGGAPQGSLTWVSEADAGSDKVNVGVTNGATNSTEKQLYFAFLSTEQLDNIFWDPTLGVDYDDGSEEDDLVSAAGGSAGAAFLAISLLLAGALQGAL